ncbi:3-dehydroquinate synthase II [Clostridium psychrophilum]|uniref:3-dehydroquinate synthase II n=1 Tax=Clostridium psychrophilum TaxID=132926 RepID=UPI001C0CAAB6|nr:3-dehydroquinate synthase II [Clostridium psychrophilum]MBU3181186.1 3-dehydroquinate synthase II [Clostridium psychrophilum]
MSDNRFSGFDYFEISDITDLGIGTRVCVDFIDVLSSTEGVLVGNTGNGFIKLMAETRKSETYPPCPFRVNLGAINQYLYLGNNKTCYLSELEPGMKIPVYDQESFRYIAIGRVKQEKREFKRVEGKNENNLVSGTFQIADSVFFQSENETFIPINDLKLGVKLAYIKSQPGRHLGDKIEEDINEK